MANITKAYHNWPAYDDDLANKAYVDTQVEGIVNGDLTTLKKAVEKNTQDINNAESDIINLNNTKLDASIYNTFISEQYNPLVIKVDNKIESYYQANDPSVNWLTSVEKETHIGDIWYNTTNQKTFVYYKDASTTPVTYLWQWQNVPIELIDSVNGKAVIYSGIIPSNYSSGDYWIIPTNCFSNTYSITPPAEQAGNYSVGMNLKFKEYTLVVDTVDASNKITSYHIDVPSNSNYSLSDSITNEDLTLTIVSASSFVLPTNCYGGSICIATASNSSYSNLDWVPRNDYVPSDLAGRYSLSEDVNSYVDSLNNTINNNYNSLYGQIGDNYDTLNGQINDNYNTLMNQMDSNYTDLSTQAQNALDRANNVDLKYESELVNVREEILRLEDRIVANIRGTGGNNLLRNSVGFRNKLYWNEVSASIIEQSYKTYANQLVTIFFRYKKTDVNNAQVLLGKYDGNTFTTLATLLNLDTIQDDWIDFTYSYTTSINNPVLRFNSSFTGIQDNDAEANGASGSKLVFDNGLIITDLMIGYGEKQPWTPYYNEVYGKTYNLDQYGLDIRENASDKYSHLDSNGLDFYDSNNNIESEFSKASTITDNIYLANSINIGNLNIIKLDDNNIIEY